VVAKDKIDWSLVTVPEKTQMEFKPSGSGNITCQKKSINPKVASSSIKATAFLSLRNSRWISVNQA